MAVRVLIDREIEPGSEAKLLQLLVQMRSKAMRTKGYISGETLRDLTDPNKFLVISTWNSVEDWKAWEAGPDRKQFQEELKPLLRVPERATIFGNF